MYEKLRKQMRFCAEDQPVEECQEKCPYFGNFRPYEYCFSKLLAEAADALEELEEKAQALAETLYAYEHPWIPVTEEPPLKAGDDGYNGYLVYADGYYEVADYTTDKFDNVPYFYVDGEYEPDVTHWMPLPAPPKEE